MARIAGGCLCGKVRYSTDAAPAFVSVCHCRDCQKFSGSAFTVVIGVAKEALTIEGETAAYAKPGDSGKTITRQFCPECGSSILDEVEVAPGLVMIGAGTLDDASWVKPTTQIYCDSAQPWVHLSGVQSYARAPG